MVYTYLLFLQYFDYMMSHSEIETIPKTNATTVPRTVAHLDLLRVGMITRLDAIALETNDIIRAEMIKDARSFVETYALTPSPAPRIPPETNDRCIAMRNGGKQCTRRRKGDTTFCGTHIRCNQSSSSGTTVTTNVSSSNLPPVGTERTLRAAVSPSGIPQFVDESGSIWCAEDVCAGHHNPREAK
jgi:hypothetical protein